MSAHEPLVTLTIRSTHYYLIDTGQGKFMVDTGWAGGLPEFLHQLRRYSIRPEEIRYFMLTHHHPDHAGLAQEIKQACGARLVILEQQIPFLERLHDYYRGQESYRRLEVEAGDLVLTGENREALKRIGLRGQIVPTPAHSDDSVSLVLDSGSAFVGDLLLPELNQGLAVQLACRSWQQLLDLNVQTVYPAHAGPFPAETVRAALKVC